MDIATAAEIIAASETGNVDRLRQIARRRCIVSLVRDAREIMLVPEFSVVKAQRGFLVFEGLSEEYTIYLPRKKDAEAWVARETARRAEIVEFEIERMTRQPAPIAAPVAPAAIQLEMFA